VPAAEEDLEIRAESTQTAGAPNRLILWPKRVSLTEENVDFLFAHAGRALAGMNAVLSPPWHAPCRGYFEEGLRKLRSAIAGQLPPQTTAEPCAIAMWRLLDDPLVSWLLGDGASLRIAVGMAGDTRLRLGIPPPSAPGPSSREALCRSEPPGPPWAHELAQAVQGDLRELIPLGLEVGVATERLRWDLPTRLPGAGAGVGSGTWQLLKELRDKLRKREAGAFEDLVTLPASSVSPGREDNDLAERLFIHHLWHCPWSDSSQGGPWRRAMVFLLKEELHGAAVTPESRLAGWRDARYRIAWEGDHRVLTHPRFADSDDETFYRLMMPVGTVFRQPYVYLDRAASSLLDAGLLLS
jgi:hypothetical protein